MINNSNKKPHIFSNTGFSGTVNSNKSLRKEIKWPGKALSIVKDTHKIATSDLRAQHKINVPSGVEFFYLIEGSTIKLIFGAGRGEIQVDIPRSFVVSIEDRIVSLNCSSIEEYATFRTTVGVIYRALLGVTRGYNQKLKTVGVGYKGAVAPNGLLNMTLGYSHPVSYPLDSSVDIHFSRKNNRFDLKGHNISIVHQTARDVQSFKEPDVYKGKGVRFRGEKLIKKEGKKKK
jgi:large subunit ribosomal protein L6